MVRISAILIVLALCAVLYCCPSKAKLREKTKITCGRLSISNKFPFLVLINATKTNTENNSATKLCAGSILKSTLILTSAGCHNTYSKVEAMFGERRLNKSESILLSNSTGYKIEKRSRHSKKPIEEGIALFENDRPELLEIPKGAGDHVFSERVCLKTWSKEWLDGRAMPKPPRDLIVASYELTRGVHISHRVIVVDCPHNRNDYICVRPAPNSTLPNPKTIQDGAPLVQENLRTYRWEQLGVYSNNLVVGGFSNNCKDMKSCILKFIPTVLEPHLSFIHAHMYSIFDKIIYKASQDQ